MFYLLKLSKWELILLEARWLISWVVIKTHIILDKEGICCAVGCTKKYSSVYFMLNCLFIQWNICILKPTYAHCFYLAGKHLCSCNFWDFYVIQELFLCLIQILHLVWTDPHHNHSNNYLGTSCCCVLILRIKFL